MYCENGSTSERICKIAKSNMDQQPHIEKQMPCQFVNDKGIITGIDDSLTKPHFVDSEIFTLIDDLYIVSVTS